jgi:peroxiredoxin
MKTIKYFFFVCIMLVLAASANAQDLQYTITGKLVDFSPMPSKIYFVEPSNTGVLAKSLDSSVVKNGAYHFSGKLLADQATRVEISTTKRLKGTKTPAFGLMVDKGDFQLISDGSLSLIHSKVTGTGALAQHQFEEMMAPAVALADSINEAQNAGDFENDKALQRRLRAAAANLIGKGLLNMYNYARQHPDARVTPYLTLTLVRESSLAQKGKDTLIAAIPQNKLNEPLQKLTIAMDKHNKFRLDSLTKVALDDQAKKYSKIAMGTKAPDFTQNDTLGKPVSLSSFKGKYVLLDFWASWCAPCRAENPNVVNAYQKYKDKGFTVLGVSLDGLGSKDGWLKAVVKDHLGWTQVSELTGGNNSAALLYDVKLIPQNFLIDPNGMIVGKNLRGEALNAKLAELFK